MTRDLILNAMILRECLAVEYREVLPKDRRRAGAILARLRAAARVCLG